MMIVDFDDRAKTGIVDWIKTNAVAREDVEAVVVDGDDGPRIVMRPIPPFPPAPD